MIKKILPDLDSSGWKYLCVLVLLTVLLRIFSPQMIGAGGNDATESWNCAKGIFYGTEYSMDHRSARFAIVLPQYAAALIFGRGPLSYYIAPAAASLVLTVFLFLAARIIRGNLFAFIVTSLTLIFPQMLIDASHPRASTFSTPLLCMVLYIILRFYKKCSDDRKSPSAWYLIAAAVITFMMYMAKEDSLYFLPAFMLILLLARKKFSDPFIYGAVLFSFYLSETLLYYIFTDYPYGRIQVILNGHLGSVVMIPVKSFLSLFDRYLQPNMQLYFTATIILSLAAGLYCAIKKWNSDRIISLVYIALINYLLLMTFLLKSISPIIPANTFRTRYLAITAPLLIIIIIYFCFEMYEMVLNKRRTVRKENGISIAAVIVCSVIVFAGGYANNQIQSKNSETMSKAKTGIQLYGSILDSGALINEHLESGKPVIFNATYMERFQEIITRVNELQKKGLNAEQAAKECGLSLETFNGFVAKYNNPEYDEYFPISFILWRSDQKITDKKIKYPLIYSFRFEGRTYGLLYLEKKLNPEKTAAALKKNKNAQVLFVNAKPFRTAVSAFAEVGSYAK